MGPGHRHKVAVDRMRARFTGCVDSMAWNGPLRSAGNLAFPPRLRRHGHDLVDVKLIITGALLPRRRAGVQAENRGVEDVAISQINRLRWRQSGNGMGFSGYTRSGGGSVVMIVVAVAVRVISS